MALLGPLIQFHQERAEASGADLRLYWDVRLVRGPGEVFARTQGESSMPGILGTKSIKEAACILEREVMEKIAKPIMARAETMAEDRANEDRNDALSPTSMLPVRGTMAESDAASKAAEDIEKALNEGHNQE